MNLDIEQAVTIFLGAVGAVVLLAILLGSKNLWSPRRGGARRPGAFGSKKRRSSGRKKKKW